MNAFLKIVINSSFFLALFFVREWTSLANHPPEVCQYSHSQIDRNDQSNELRVTMTQCLLNPEECSREDRIRSTRRQPAKPGEATEN